MSSLLQRIARGRLASASRRLGPASQNGGVVGESNGWVPLEAPPEEMPPEDTSASEAERAADAEQEVRASGAMPPESDVSSEAQLTEEPERPQPSPGVIKRGRLRRRARDLRQLRELQLRDIGGFLLESSRLGSQRPELLEAKLAAAAQTDHELRSLESALGAGQRVSELRIAGIGGACQHCGAVFGSSDRFCSSCGKPV